VSCADEAEQGRGDLGDFHAFEQRALQPSRGGRCAVSIRFQRSDAAALVNFGDEWTVRPSRELVERLGQIVGRDGVEIVYAPRTGG